MSNDFQIGRRISAVTWKSDVLASGSDNDEMRETTTPYFYVLLWKEVQAPFLRPVLEIRMAKRENRRMDISKLVASFP